MLLNKILIKYLRKLLSISFLIKFDSFVAFLTLESLT